MKKSQTNMNQLNQKNEQNLHRQKGKARLGYNEEKGESSKKCAKRNQKPTCNHYGKIGHTSNKFWSNRKTKFNGKCYNCNKHVTKLMNEMKNLNLKVNVTNAKDMVTRHQNADPNHSIQLNNL